MYYVNQANTRICIICKRSLPIGNFPKRGRGISQTCQSCLDVQKRVIPLPQCNLQQSIGFTPEELHNRLNALVKGVEDNAATQHTALITAVSTQLNNLEERIRHDQEMRHRTDQEMIRRMEQEMIHRMEQEQEREAYIQNELITLRQRIDATTTSVETISANVNTLSTDVTSLHDMLTLVDSNIREQMTALVNSVTQSVDTIKTEVNNIISPIYSGANTPVISGVNTPIQITARSPAIPHTNLPQQVPTTNKTKRDVSFSDYVFSQEYIRAITDSDLPKYINTASNSASYFKQRGDNRYDTAKMNADLLRNERDARKRR